ncbi:PIN domain-containing protein [Verrucomicrobia bacterium]|nr:PIN domain-containing protein [bacterium]MDA7866827.1 PIN domain-containing protein [Verrucomicrobiota bacterium]MDA7866834.1 PIN domain-containing protein [Verrucomicrobiota bacterium]
MLRKKGASIATNDLWIAALVIQHNVVLCTSDSHFNQVSSIVTC